MLRGFAKDVHETAHDDVAYTHIRDTVMLEILCDIRDNLNYIAGNIRDYGYESQDGE